MYHGTSVNVSRSAEVGPLWEAVRVWAELEQTGLLLLKTECGFCGCFVEEVSHRIVSAVTVPHAWADCGVVAEAIEDFNAREAL